VRRGTSGLNLLIAVNKPLGITSHDAVGRVRRALGERRVGHAGTLDPDASGVLVMGVGQGTRLMGHLTLDDKGYLARFELGSQTTTDDAEGDELFSAPVPAEATDEDFARRTVASLVGNHLQVPPAYSAISVDGRRAYARARAGEEVELEARPITIHEAELVAVEAGERPVWVARLLVSKGTYVRSIARDLGRELGCGAHLVGLVRTSSGPIGEAACLTLDEVAELGAGGITQRALDPVLAVGLAVRALAPAELADVRCGRQLRAGLVRGVLNPMEPRAPKDGERVCLVVDGRLYGIWQERAGMLACDANFPDGVAGVRGDWSL